jgi:hypothetical protein
LQVWCQRRGMAAAVALAALILYGRMLAATRE